MKKSAIFLVVILLVLVACAPTSNVTQPNPPEKVILKITSIPDKVEIIIDGKSMGVTPMDLPLAVGEYDTRLEKAGWATQEFTLKIFPSDIEKKTIPWEISMSR